MKSFIHTLTILLIAFKALSQETSPFKERNSLRVEVYTYTVITKDKSGNDSIGTRDSANYFDLTEKKLVVHQKKYEKTSVRTHTINGGPTFYLDKLDSLDKGKDSTVKMNFLRSRLAVDIKAEDGKIMIYPWPLVEPIYTRQKDADGNKIVDLKKTAKNKAINEYISNRDFFIDLPDRKVAQIRYVSLHTGAITLPLKVYLAGQMSPINNVTFDVNINAMVGLRYGRDRFVHLPNSKEPITSKRAFSINYILGVSKIELDSAGTTSHISDKHTLAGISQGLAFGFQYKAAGVFIATGVDLPIGRDSEEWNFYRMPWIGFGIGVKLD